MLNEINVRYDDGQTVNTRQIGYFENASIESILRSTKLAFCLLPDAQVSLMSEDGHFLSSTNLYPCSIVAVLHPPSAGADEFQCLNNLKKLAPNDDLPTDSTFQERYVKFERIVSHLANERTWLCWIRASFLLLSVGLTTRALSDEIAADGHPAISRSLLWIGNGYAVTAPVTAVLGYLRFENTKRMLQSPIENEMGSFDPFGIIMQTGFILLVVLMTVGCYWSMGFYYFA